MYLVKAKNFLFIVCLICFFNLFAVTANAQQYQPHTPQQQIMNVQQQVQQFEQGRPKNKYLIEEKIDVKDVIQKLEETKHIIFQINNPRMNKQLLIQDIDEIINNLRIFVN